MADYKGYFAASMKAGLDMSARQYAIVTDLTANDNYVNFGATSTRYPLGILQNKPKASGAAAEIALVGVALCKMRSAVTAGSPIVMNASSFGVSATSSHGWPVGRALYGGSVNDIVPVVLCGGGSGKSRNSLCDLAVR